MDPIDELKNQLDTEIASTDLGDGPKARLAFQALKAQFLGKKGSVSGLMRRMGDLPPNERPEFGKRVNALRELTETRLGALESALEEREIEASLQKCQADPSLPGWRIPLGTMHPVNQVREESLEFFRTLGFELATGREIDTDWYNFEALNIPPNHPARDMQDTFYVDRDVVLRTQTSNIQIHVMESRQPPFKIIAPGVVYRVDNDATHAPMFHQMEGLVVDEDISFADLKGTLFLWARFMFGESVRMRFRPSFFPFTEPSAEMDVSCVFCGGKGCRSCKGTGWMELGGCGCVDPNVFAKVGIDPERYLGFAFGFGLDRIAMTKFGIPSIDLLFKNDMRFLRQF